MNFRAIGNYLGKILWLEGATMIPPCIIAICLGEGDSAIAFGITIFLLALCGWLFSLIKVNYKNMYAREGFIIVAVSWIILSLFGALPFTLSGNIKNYLDAVFETVSGFTTTGATILNDVEVLTKSMLYWRSFTHWLGGMGVLVFVLAIAPLGGGSGKSLHILRAESAGPTVSKIAPKMHSTARILYSIYILLTIIMIILLICGGMPVFDSVTLSFGTAGTGGFALLNSGIATYSAYSQWVIGIFMMLFGVNFSVFYLLMIRDIKGAFKNTELWVYIGVVAASTTMILSNTYNMYNSLSEGIRHTFFSVTSIMSTTGYSTVSFVDFPEFSKCIVLILMFTGACAGSTCGGFKLSRLVILCKAIHREVKKLLHPQCVAVVKIDGKQVEDETVNRAAILMVIYVIIIGFSTLIISIDGLSFETNFSSVVSCSNNIGPAFGSAASSMACFSPMSKIVLIFDMLFGRLEVFPMLMLFAPETWKKR